MPVKITHIAVCPNKFAGKVHFCSSVFHNKKADTLKNCNVSAFEPKYKCIKIDTGRHNIH